MLSTSYVSFLLISSIVLIILLSSRFKINTFFVLILVAMAVGMAAGMDGDAMLKALKVGFGGTLEKIGLLIILGSTLGVILDKTNATLSLANYILARTGERYAPFAITLIGFLIGLPIFCDSGFVVLSGLAVSLGKKMPLARLVLVGCLATSLYAVHCLVPPHPGIMAAAGTLGVDIGKAMLFGTLLALPGAAVGYWWANRQGKLLNDPQVQDSYETLSLAESPQYLPSAGLSFLPIVVPIALIALKSIVLLSPSWLGAIGLSMIKLAGEPIMALLVGIVLTFPLFPSFDKTLLNRLMDDAIEKAGPILAVTAAGGAFGEIIKGLDLGQVYGGVFADSGLGLAVPFVLALVFKTAQGSSTVAIISTASLLTPLLPVLGFQTADETLFALMAMGAGSMCVSHANDSYFWVISRFGNVNVSQTLRLFSVASALMGLTSLLVLLVARWLLG